LGGLVAEMIGFYPRLKINYDWKNLINLTKQTAELYIRTGEFKNHMLYEHGASLVAKGYQGGWISKQNSAYDFFVTGGIPETEELELRFKNQFVNFTFTPASMGYSTSDVPLHSDSIKNGQCSLVYPLHNVESIGEVYGDNETFVYEFKQDCPIIIDITKKHKVVNNTERVWFTIHFHESIEQVKKEFDRLGEIIL
jgi:hypothetical protein